GRRRCGDFAPVRVLDDATAAPAREGRTPGTLGGAVVSAPGGSSATPAGNPLARRLSIGTCPYDLGGWILESRQCAATPSFMTTHTHSAFHRLRRGLASAGVLLVAALLVAPFALPAAAPGAQAEPTEVEVVAEPVQS